MKMKILIIGAKGMLGQAMVKVFEAHHVVGLDVSDVDITHPREVSRALDTYRPNALINCAAYTAVDQCETDEAKANLVNGTAVGYLAKTCELQKIPIVHISTDYVFDGQNQHGYKEDDRPNPVNAYGRTKLHGEEQLQLNTMRYYLIRTSWLYGSGGKNFVTTMLELGKTKPELKVVNDQHGKPTYTVDLAAFIKNLVLEHAPYGIYHGVNEPETTWYDFAVEIFRQAGMSTKVLPCTSDEYPRLAKRPAWSTLHNTQRPVMRYWTDALREYLSVLSD